MNGEMKSVEKPLKKEYGKNEMSLIKTMANEVHYKTKQKRII
jgi:hypothetical protein